MDTLPRKDVLLSDVETEIARLAPTRATVLVVGGDEEARASFAKALHDRSPRAHGPFVTVDCSVLSGADAERVLFGGPSWVRGGIAFEAATGTLYLASVSEIPLVVQPRLFGFLDEDTNVRVVAGSAIELEASALRPDLGARLELVKVVLTRTNKR